MDNLSRFVLLSRLAGLAFKHRACKQYTKHEVQIDRQLANFLSLYFQGVISLKRADMDCYYLFVKTPTLEELVTYLEFVLNV